MTNNKDDQMFALTLCSDLNYEGMVVDVNFNDQSIAIANYEKGVGNIEIEIFPSSQKDGKWVVPLADFMKILEKARKILEKCAEEDKTRKKY